jgi:serine/threonine protein kinase
MEDTLEVGKKIKTLFGGTLTVEKYLAEGGQGRVFLVKYKGEKKALKWYKNTGLGRKPEKFYDNIKQNIMRGTPSDEFLWPLDITEWVDGTFGYVMDLKPEGYHEITDFMLCKVRFKSYRTIIDAALKIVSAFRILHNRGYSYQDLNDGNFFINPENGKVLICDNDNVAPDGMETGIIGKPRYMAPEIVLGKSKPNSLSDRFSMSLILYILFCLDHPLEGKRYLVPALTAALQEKLYGSEPIFMMDPNDDRNRPHKIVHKNSRMVWPQLPDYIREIFINAFSKKAFEKPSSRPREIEWLNVFTRFRSDIVPCVCGNEIFTQQGESRTCEECGRKTDVSFKLVLSNYSIPAIRDTRIYRCQLGVCDETEALSPIARVLKKKNENAYGIKNLTEKRWDAVTTKGIARKVAPEEVIPLKDGIKFTVAGATIIIEENK